MNRRLTGKPTILAIMVIATLAAFQYLGPETAPPTQPDSTSHRTVNPTGWSSGQWLTVSGRVQRTLADDRDGSRHQRFILLVPDGRTLLVAHNIDLAERVPLHAGDQLSIHGRYENNDRGGVIHWTHHDPDGRTPGGWIEFRGERYR